MKKNIKKTGALLGLVVLCSNLLSQANDAKKYYCDEIMRYSYIFEGKIISTKYGVTVKTDNAIYHDSKSYTVVVQKTVKGNIQKDTIQLVELGGNVISADERVVATPKEAIYICSVEASKKSSNASNASSEVIEYVTRIPLSNGELKDDKYGITQYFSTKQEFYDYLRANYGVKIEE